MAKPCLILIDFINEIIHEEGKAPSCAKYVSEHGIIEKINEAMTWARKNQYKIIHVKLGFKEDYSNCSSLSPMFKQAMEKKAFLLNSWGTEFHSHIQVAKEDLVVIKHRVSAFYATDLEVILRSEGIDTLVIAGASTNMAVEAAAREAHDRDYRVVILEDVCGAYDENWHHFSLQVMSRFSKVISVKELDGLTNEDA